MYVWHPAYDFYQGQNNGTDKQKNKTKVSEFFFTKPPAFLKENTLTHWQHLGAINNKIW